MRVYILGDVDTYRNYGRAVAIAGGEPCYLSRDPENCDALLLPGGGDIEPWRYGQENTASHSLDAARDDAEQSLLEQFISRGKPVLGICRGMQAINVFLGGDLIQDWPGHSAVNGRDRLHSVRTAPSVLQTFCGERCIVNSSHHQIVGKLGEDLTAVQWADDGAIEAFCHKALPIWGIQWHPERLLERQNGAVISGLPLYQAFLALKPFKK